MILGARYPAVALVQSLAPRGVDCIVCAPRPLQAAWSRHARYRWMPDCAAQPDRALVRLEALLRRLDARALVFPAGDMEALFLAGARERLAPMADCVVPDTEAVRLALDKSRFYEWAAGKGLSCPTAAPLGHDPPLPFPFVVKPRNYSELIASGVRARDGAVPARFKFMLIEDARSWARFSESHGANRSRFVAQQLVPGGTGDRFSICAFATREAGIVRAFAARILRTWPDGYGNTILAENACVPAEVLAEASRALGALPIEGMAELEYRREPATGAFRLIEINPRVSTWTQLARGGPADVVWAAYLHACGERVPPGTVNEPPGRLKLVRAIADLSNAWLRLPRGHPARRIGLSAWRRSIAAATTHVVETDRGDWPLALACTGFQIIDMLRGN